MKWGHRKNKSRQTTENRKVKKSDLEDITKLLNDLPEKDKKFLVLNQKLSLIKKKH